MSVMLYVLFYSFLDKSQITPHSIQIHPHPLREGLGVGVGPVFILWMKQKI